jgi:hypothetical protein
LNEEIHGEEEGEGDADIVCSGCDEAYLRDATKERWQVLVMRNMGMADIHTSGDDHYGDRKLGIEQIHVLTEPVIR